MAGARTEIRRLAYADLPQVVSIERRAFTTPWSLAMFVLELSKPGGVCLAAVRGAGEEGEADPRGRVVGYCVCSRYDRVWHLMNVSVDPDCHRQGVARALLTELLGRVGGDEARITLEVRPSNEAALRLYEGFGFKAAGRRPRYYQDNGEDALILWRTPGTLAGTFDDVPNAAPPRA
ncbi:MAG TPA: ribosomal protein S18-alanine N-acetyltransferase [Capillimicrobium sp.]